MTAGSTYYTGSNNDFLQLKPSSLNNANDYVTLTFSKPVDAVGMFIGGLGNQSGAINFIVNSTTLFTVNGSEDAAAGGTAVGGLAYYGFTDSTPFTSLKLYDPSASDEFAITEVDYDTAPVPEPSTVASFLIAGVFLGGLLIGKRRRAARAA